MMDFGDMTEGSRNRAADHPDGDRPFRVYYTTRNGEEVFTGDYRSLSDAVAGTKGLPWAVTIRKES